MDFPNATCDGADRRPTPAIAFAVPSCLGHFYPTLPLARRLEARGFRVIYLLVEKHRNDVRNRIEREGFTVRDVQEFGGLTAVEGLIRACQPRLACDCFEQIVRQVGRWVQEHRVQLLLVDNCVRYVGVAFSFNRIPVATLCANYGENRFVSEPISKRRRRERLPLPATAWRMLVRRWRQNPGVLLDLLFGVQRRIARHARLHRLKTDFLIYNQMRMFNYPELFLAPAQLLPRPDRASRYLGLCIAERRSSPANGFIADHCPKPYVYASLGTLGAQSSHAPKIVAALTTAFSSGEGLDLVLQIEAGLGDKPAGGVGRVRVFHEVPQLDVIAKAKLVVTHGGLGTLKECIYHGVPVVVIPLETEQLFNARLIVERGLGRMLEAETISAAEVATTIESMLSDSGYRSRVSAMRQNIGDHEPVLDAGVELLEAMMSKEAAA